MVDKPRRIALVNPSIETTNVAVEYGRWPKVNTFFSDQWRCPWLCERPLAINANSATSKLGDRPHYDSTLLKFNSITAQPRYDLNHIFGLIRPVGLIELLLWKRHFFFWPDASGG